MKSIQNGREFLKAGPWVQFPTLGTDQQKQAPAPALEKPYPPDARLIDLVPPQDFSVGQMPLIESIRARRSRRQYAPDPLTREELSFLLWATQGVHEVMRGGTATRRTVPSGGARHPFETYVLVNRVTEIEPGLYRYLALKHKLCFVKSGPEVVEQIHSACLRQYVEASAVTFIWTAIPYRTEWRYGVISPKLIALDAGHVCQNLYLACEAIGAGTCAIGAYDQDALDAALDVDGQEELAVYVATVGKIAAH